MSQHIGDLDTLEARRAFENAIDDLCRLYCFKPELVACDLHPDYASTHWALASGLPIVRVQHHQAHAAACAAENGMRGPYLACPGTAPATGWTAPSGAGRFFLVEDGRFERVAHLRTFRLPGGEAAIKEGWRSEAGLLYETFGPDAVADPVIRRMIERGVNAPLTSSVGRLFDAVSSMAGVARESRFEGQAAMLLERAIGCETGEAYALRGKAGIGGRWSRPSGAMWAGRARARDRGAVSQRAGELDSRPSAAGRRPAGRVLRRRVPEWISGGACRGAARKPRFRGVHAPAGPGE